MDFLNYKHLDQDIAIVLTMVEAASGLSDMQGKMMEYKIHHFVHRKSDHRNILVLQAMHLCIPICLDMSIKVYMQIISAR